MVTKMNLYHDKHIRFFYLFLFFFMLLIFLSGTVLCIGHANAAKNELLSHDEAMVSSLLSQGVSEDIIVTAMAGAGNTGSSGSFFCFIIIAVFLLSFFLFAGTFLFLKKRECLYQEAADTVKSYIDGDYSHHLPQNEEGTIYYVFHLIEELATILQSKNETEHRTKEFLKDTISDISHQLKTPLAACSIYQEIMEKEPEKPDVVKEFSHKTNLAIKRMEQLIQSMLKLTRLDTGNIIFEKETCSISDLVEHALSELITRAQIENKNIMMPSFPTEAAPDVLSGDTLICDRVWTSEAIGNIVKNALDHTTSGDTIQISWESSPLMTRIMISDNGEGISPEDIPHIFKRFYRSRNASKIPGIGLGLPLAKSIIEKQGGVLSVKSTLQEGTTFTLTFLTKL